MTPEQGQKIEPRIGCGEGRLSRSQECAPGHSIQRDGQTEGTQTQPSMPMEPTDLLAEAVFGKPGPQKTPPRRDPTLASKFRTPKWGLSLEKRVVGHPFWSLRGPTKVFFGGSSVPVQCAHKSQVSKHLGRNTHASLRSLTPAFLRQLVAATAITRTGVATVSATDTLIPKSYPAPEFSPERIQA